MLVTYVAYLWNSFFCEFCYSSVCCLLGADHSLAFLSSDSYKHMMEFFLVLVLIFSHTMMHPSYDFLFMVSILIVGFTDRSDKNKALLQVYVDIPNNYFTVSLCISSGVHLG